MTDRNEQEGPWVDTIVAEVRAARMALFAAAGYDLERLAERLQQEQASSGRRVVTFRRGRLRRRRAKPHSVVLSPYG